MTLSQKPKAKSLRRRVKAAMILEPWNTNKQTLKVDAGDPEMTQAYFSYVLVRSWSGPER